MIKIVKKYQLKKTTQKDDDYFFSTCYDYEIFLKNFNTKWYIKIEKPTKKCKFYSIFTRFENKDSFEELKKIFTNMNEYSGKFNHFVYDTNSIENIINNVIMANSLKESEV